MFYSIENAVTCVSVLQEMTSWWLPDKPGLWRGAVKMWTIKVPSVKVKWQVRVGHSRGGWHYRFPHVKIWTPQLLWVVSPSDGIDSNESWVFPFALKPINLWIYFHNGCNFVCMSINTPLRSFLYLVYQFHLLNLSKTASKLG